ncbi:MAG TPA: hypothetical protein VIL42_04115 [Sphingomicrobium sp.]
MTIVGHDASDYGSKLMARTLKILSEELAGKYERSGDTARLVARARLFNKRPHRLVSVARIKPADAHVHKALKHWLACALSSNPKTACRI